MTTHRFAFTISGGLAMGAYEAGVLSQLYRDFTSINESALEVKLVIDAISGASAGSMTGLILAQALALKLTPDKFEQIMRAAWIAGPDISALLQPANGPEDAIFTQNRLDAIADAAIGDETPAGEPNYDETIAIWMAITNLEGIPFKLSFPGLPDQNTDVYGYSYKDFIPYFISGKDIRDIAIPTEELSNPAPVNPAEWWARCPVVGWKDAAASATASGSFPVAFKSKPITRDLDRYKSYTDIKQPGWPDKLTFQVIDGGTFGNEPIGKAIDAVAYLEKINPARAGDGRTFLIIEPNPTNLKQVGDSLAAVETENTPNGLPLPTVLSRLVSAYFNTALYGDFINTLEINDQIEAVQNLDVPKNVKDQILKIFGLDYKKIVTLERIPNKVPNYNRLAGDFFGDFGGFLLEGFRAFDFSVGQVEARAWIETWLNANATQLHTNAAVAIATLNGTPTQSVPDLSDSSWCKNMPEDRRREIVNQGLDRLVQLVDMWFNLNWAGKEAVSLLRDAIGETIVSSLANCPEAPAVAAPPENL